jgi:hypothetical protein
MYKSLLDALRSTASVCEFLAKQAETAESDMGQVLYVRNSYPDMIHSIGNLLVELGRVKLVD